MWDYSRLPVRLIASVLTEKRARRIAGILNAQEEEPAEETQRLVLLERYDETCRAWMESDQSSYHAGRYSEALEALAHDFAALNRKEG